LQTWSTERQPDQQCPLAQIETHLTTTTSRLAMDIDWKMALKKQEKVVVVNMYFLQKIAALWL
jgi:hypothetical protein